MDGADESDVTWTCDALAAAPQTYFDLLTHGGSEEPILAIREQLDPEVRGACGEGDLEVVCGSPAGEVELRQRTPRMGAAEPQK